MWQASAGARSDAADRPSQGCSRHRAQPSRGRDYRAERQSWTVLGSVVERTTADALPYGCCAAKQQCCDHENRYERGSNHRDKDDEAADEELNEAAALSRDQDGSDVHSNIVPPAHAHDRAAVVARRAG
jgi:hypothetical protein